MGLHQGFLRFLGCVLLGADVAAGGTGTAGGTPLAALNRTLKPISWSLFRIRIRSSATLLRRISIFKVYMLLSPLPRGKLSALFLFRGIFRGSRLLSVAIVRLGSKNIAPISRRLSRPRYTNLDSPSFPLASTQRQLLTIAQHVFQGHVGGGS